MLLRIVHLGLLLASLSLSACASLTSTQAKTSTLVTEQRQQKQIQLQQLLSNLSPLVDSNEAASVAQVALHYPLQLAKKYQLTTGPILHNILVNAGIKKRGLCIHWTEDLLLKLAELNLKSLHLSWGVANKTATFSLEHSAVVVSAIEQSFKQGIVLDGWRHSGELYFSPVIKDKYDWQQEYNRATAKLLLDP